MCDIIDLAEALRQREVRAFQEDSHPLPEMTPGWEEGFDFTFVDPETGERVDISEGDDEAVVLEFPRPDKK